MLCLLPTSLDYTSVLMMKSVCSKLQGIVSQTILLFIVTTVRTSSPTIWSNFSKFLEVPHEFQTRVFRLTLISDGLGWPNGLTIDRPAGRLYWNDGKCKTIESSDLSGQDRRVVVTDVPHPYGLVIVGTHVYWTDWQTKALHRADKIKGTESTIIRGKLEGLMDVRSVQVRPSKTDSRNVNYCCVPHLEVYCSF